MTDKKFGLKPLVSTPESAQRSLEIEERLDRVLEKIRNEGYKS